MRRYPHRVRFLIATQIIDPATSPTRFAPGGICLQRRTTLASPAIRWASLRSAPTYNFAHATLAEQHASVAMTLGPSGLARTPSAPPVHHAGG